MRFAVRVALFCAGAAACSSSGTKQDAGSTTDGAGDVAAPMDVAAETLVAPGVKCTNINLSCFNPNYPNCFEYTNADDQKVTSVTEYCATVQGTVARGPCPPGMTAGCGFQNRMPCENVWYYGFSPELITQVCGSMLILP